MTSKTSIIAAALLLSATLSLSATSAALAQSQRNYGPNGSASGNSFGEPYSGSAAARIGERHAAHRLYAYYPYHHRR